VRYRTATFARIDGLAHGSLSRSDFLLYQTYRDSLMAQGEQTEHLFALLSAFVFTQYERCLGMTVH